MPQAIIQIVGLSIITNNQQVLKECPDSIFTQNVIKNRL